MTQFDESGTEALLFIHQLLRRPNPQEMTIIRQAIRKFGLSEETAAHLYAKPLVQQQSQDW